MGGLGDRKSGWDGGLAIQMLSEASARVYIQVLAGLVHVAFESVSKSIEVDERCAFTTPTATTQSSSAIDIHHWLGCRRYSLRGQTMLRVSLPRVLPMSSRRALRAREAIGLAAIARRLLPVALDFGPGAGVTGRSKPAICFRCRH